MKDPRRRVKDVLTSQEEEVSSATDKRSVKDIIKRLQPRRSLRDGPDQTKKASLEKEGGWKGTSPGALRLRENLDVRCVTQSGGAGPKRRRVGKHGVKQRV